MLISETYANDLKTMHAQDETWGAVELGFTPIISAVLKQYQASHVLDYGCGKGKLRDRLSPFLCIHRYDPGIPQWSASPEPCEFVVCVDVLEHIEPECLDDVLDDLARVTEKAGFFTVHSYAAIKTLPNGRNAHLIQEDYRWWLPKLWARFDVGVFKQTGSGFFVVVERRKFAPSQTPMLRMPTIE